MANINIDSNFWVHQKTSDVHDYTHLAIPIHRSQNVQFEDVSGITTWADEIDYGKINNFGWEGSNYNVNGTYESLINAMQNCINALHERISALENPTVVEFNILPSMDMATGLEKLSIQNITGGDANNTNWEVVPVGTWKNNAAPYFLQKSALSIATDQITGASQVLISQNTLTYPNEIRGINKIKVGSSSYSNGQTIPVNANTAQTFKSFNLGITLNNTTTYKCKVKATNGGTSKESAEYSLTPMQDPDSYEWYLADTNGTIKTPSASFNNMRTYSVSSQLTIIITNYNTATPSITWSPNRITNDTSFRLYCKISSANIYQEAVKYVTFNIKAPEQQVNYYWYISLTAPTNIQTVNNPAGTAQEGWHLIGTSINGYEYDATNEDTLFNAPQDIANEAECIWYVALPQNTPLKIYDQQGTLQMTDVIGTVQCSGITYDVYNYGPLWRWDAYIVKSVES